MRSRTTKAFRTSLRNLPDHVQRQARKAYLLFRTNPSHPSLRFKQVDLVEPIFSVRVGIGYRAMAVREGKDLIWFWIGSHADYDQLLRRRG